MLRTVHSGTAFGVLILVLLIGLATGLHRHPSALIDLLPRGWISDKDRSVLRDPAAANKTAYETMSREAWQRLQAQQPAGGWARDLNH
jgi:hypothetical protein